MLNCNVSSNYVAHISSTNPRRFSRDWKVKHFIERFQKHMDFLVSIAMLIYQKEHVSIHKVDVDFFPSSKNLPSFLCRNHPPKAFWCVDIISRQTNRRPRCCRWWCCQRHFPANHFLWGSSQRMGSRGTELGEYIEFYQVLQVVTSFEPISDLFGANYDLQLGNQKVTLKKLVYKLINT